MARSKIDVLICDRCGHRSEEAGVVTHKDWGMISGYSSSLGSSGNIGHFTGKEYKYQDLCPVCYTNVVDWFHDKEKYISD